METKRQYYGLDVVKIVLAMFVAARHVIQIFFTQDSRAHLLIGAWLSNLAVPSFFLISAFFLFRKAEEQRWNRTLIISYCSRIIKLYLVWSALYLPIDWYNWSNGTASLKEGIGDYIQSFFFSSSTVQLWYLPALCVAAWIVWFLYTKGVRLWQILVITGLLFLTGVIGDNWYLNEQLPVRLYKLLELHNGCFITMRNGLFYGTFYFAMGLLLVKKNWRLPLWVAGAGTVAGLYLMYQEVVHWNSTNMVLSAAPTVYCLFTVASAMDWKPRALYPRLRAMSEWIYLSHFYFFYLFAWTLRWNPIPANNKTILLMILGTVTLFSWGMVRLSERKRFAWLKHLV